MKKVLFLSATLGLSLSVLGSGSYGSGGNPARMKAKAMKGKMKEVKTSNFRCLENEILKDCIERYKKAKAESKK